MIGVIGGDLAKKSCFEENTVPLIKGAVPRKSFALDYHFE
jgi:hypothetical protein